MPKRFVPRILRHLADQRYRPGQIHELARDLAIAPDEERQFRQAVQHLIDEGQVVLASANAIALPPPGRQMIGIIRVNARGFGFLVPDAPTEHGDLFVPAPHVGGALSGDRVRAQVVHERARAGAGRSPYTGRVVEILQRANKHFVGNLAKRGARWVVEVDGTRLAEPVTIRDPHARNAKVGDKVVIELLAYPSEDEPAEGVIVDVLGEQGEPDVETKAVMRAFGLVEHFDDEVLNEARQAARSFSDDAIPPGRVDLTDQFIVTIDPPDARDFDDAISLRKLQDAGDAVYELGVHIADVAHFVQRDGALDREASQRGNSVYLPRKVVPMLPELLSNGVCSLQEGVNRLCKSAFIEYDAAGAVVGQRFCRSVIHSGKRMTYREAQALIDDDIKEACKHARTEPKYPRQLIQQVKLMDELARVIRKRRLGEGMITLDLPEVELVFDDTGRVTDAHPQDDAFTHKIIEMFMVEANEAVARLFNTLNVPMIRRVHPDPPSHDLGELRQFARVAGFVIPTRPTRHELQALLDAVRGKPAQYAVHLAVLQTLSKAEYSPLLVGHFALASEHYTHFTSPIRRYPDLVVHRGLEAYFDLFPEHYERRLPGGKALTRLGRDLRADPRLPDEPALVQLGRHCSGTERNAEAAERELRTFLVLQLLAEHLGDDFNGTVTGVTGDGLFVQLDRYLVDGYIRAADLAGFVSAPGDRWRLDRTTGALVAQRSGRRISIGDRFVVRIAQVQPARRKLDLVIVGDPRRATTKKRKQPAGAANAHRQTMAIKRKRRVERRKRR